MFVKIDGEGWNRVKFPSGKLWGSQQEAKDFAAKLRLKGVRTRTYKSAYRREWCVVKEDKRWNKAYKRESGYNYFWPYEAKINGKWHHLGVARNSEEARRVLVSEAKKRGISASDSKKIPIRRKK